MLSIIISVCIHKQHFSYNNSIPCEYVINIYIYIYIHIFKIVRVSFSQRESAAFGETRVLTQEHVANQFDYD